MADGTAIEWTDATWNIITGCSIVSPGCTNCYAQRLAGTRLQHHPSRQGLTVPSKAGPVWTGEVRFNEAWLRDPLKWRRPRMIFVAAHGDLFHEGVTRQWLDMIFAVMALSPQHTFQILTKRPDRAARYTAGDTTQLPQQRVARMMEHLDPKSTLRVKWPLPNVWIGTSVEDQARALRLYQMISVQAAVKWASFEPLLGAVDPRHIAVIPEGGMGYRVEPLGTFDALTGLLRFRTGGERQYDSLSWAVVGGESGPAARPMHPDWARSLRDQCAEAGVPYFFKQWGQWAPVGALNDAQSDALFVPAPERYPDAIRRCKVEHHVLHSDGSRHAALAAGAFAVGTGAMTMFSTGKAVSGRLLDGCEHNAMPGASS